MKHQMRVMCPLLLIVMATAFAGDQASDPASLRLLFSEVKAGSMATENYCTLVFANHHYHFEKANRKMGKDRDRKIYEGELSEGDWTALKNILDARELRELKVDEDVPSLVIQDAHTFTISIARDAKFQNMEFLDNRSRKPYENQLKPLLDWWKTFRSQRLVESNASPDSRCALDSTRGVFSQ